MGTTTAECTHHDYWVFPILVDDPQAFVSGLRAEGFDSSGAARTTLISPPPDRPQLEATIAAQALSDLVIVPCYVDMPDAEIEREARVIKEIAKKVVASRTRAYANAVPTPVMERGAEAPH